MGASIDGEEDHSGDDEPTHPRPGHRITTLEIRHHRKRTHQGEGHTYYQCPKSDRPRTYAAAAAGTPTQKTTRPKLDPTANAKVNTLVKSSREEAQTKPEPTRRSNLKRLAPQDQKSPGPNQEEKIHVPTVEPTIAADPPTPPEAAASVGPTHPEGTPEKGAPTNAPPPEAQGEPEETQATGAEEGKESTATARTPTATQATEKVKKKSKHSKKKVDSSSEEEIEVAWKQVKVPEAARKAGRKKRKGGGPGPKGNRHCHEKNHSPNPCKMRRWRGTRT
ncbi:hypothetical protein NDU88_002575 [Pleurodeles waltl]|uniref:Uncharacterized protein n=1 Tax=Pleurodeles waltl TaxID=8319 RepID=A0AAV7RE72_PLEWA|nr:hypothetical protein NDU88_002575 [Pleurodeles waltl]